MGLFQEGGDRFDHQLKEEGVWTNRIQRFFEVNRYRQRDPRLLLFSQSFENVGHLLKPPLIEQSPLSRKELRERLLINHLITSPLLSSAQDDLRLFRLQDGI